MCRRTSGSVEQQEELGVADAKLNARLPGERTVPVLKERVSSVARHVDIIGVRSACCLQTQSCAAGIELQNS